MKRYGLIICILLTLSVISSHAETSSVDMLLKDGIYAERAEGNLDKAIGLYEQVVEQAGNVKKLAAEATFQMGWCYLKKGEMNVAREMFGQVVENFPDETVFVAKAKEMIEQLGTEYPENDVNKFKLMEFGKPYSVTGNISKHTGLFGIDLDKGKLYLQNDTNPDESQKAKLSECDIILNGVGNTVNSNKLVNNTTVRDGWDMSVNDIVERAIFQKPTSEVMFTMERGSNPFWFLTDEFNAGILEFNFAQGGMGDFTFELRYKIFKTDITPLRKSFGETICDLYNLNDSKESIETLVNRINGFNSDFIKQELIWYISNPRIGSLAINYLDKIDCKDISPFKDLIAQHLSNANQNIRIDTAEVILKYKLEEHYDRLIDMTINDSNAYLRSMLAYKLSNIFPEKLLARLDKATSDPDMTIREHAEEAYKVASIFPLSWSGKEPEMQLLDGPIRETILAFEKEHAKYFVLGESYISRTDKNSIESKWQQELNGGNPNRIVWGIASLGNIRDRNHVKEFCYIAKTPTYNKLGRVMAIRALARMKDENSIATLAKLIDHEDNEIRAYARLGLANMLGKTFLWNKEAWANWISKNNSEQAESTTIVNESNDDLGFGPQHEMNLSLPPYINKIGIELDSEKVYLETSIQLDNDEFYKNTGYERLDDMSKAQVILDCKNGAVFLQNLAVNRASESDWHKLTASNVLEQTIDRKITSQFMGFKGARSSLVENHYIGTNNRFGTIITIKRMTKDGHAASENSIYGFNYEIRYKLFDTNLTEEARKLAQLIDALPINDIRPPLSFTEILQYDEAFILEQCKLYLSSDWMGLSKKTFTLLRYHIFSTIEPLKDELVRIMNEGDSELRYKAALTLSDYHYPDSQDYLIASVFRYSSNETVCSLARQQDPYIIETLRNETNASDYNRRKRASQLLEIIEIFPLTWSGDEPEMQLLEERTRKTINTFENEHKQYFIFDDNFANTNERSNYIDLWSNEVNDDDVNRKVWGMAALGNIRSLGKYDILAEYAKIATFDNLPRVMAVRGLARIGNEKTIDVLIELVDHEDERIRAYARLGLAKMLGVNFKGDKEAWTKWIAEKKGIAVNLNSEQAATLNKAAWTLWGQGKMVEAEKLFKQAVELDPELANAYQGLGWAQMNLGQYDEARKSFAECIKLEPQNVAALNGLGWVSKHWGQTDKAIEYWLTALEISDGKSTAVLNGLINTYWLKKDYTNAIKYVEMWLEIEPENPDLKDRLKTLKGLADGSIKESDLSRNNTIQPLSDQTPENTIKNFLAAAMTMNKEKAMRFIDKDAEIYNDVEEIFDKTDLYHMVFQNLDKSQPYRIVELTISGTKCKAKWELLTGKDIQYEDETIKAGKAFLINADLARKGDKWLITDL